MTPRLLFAALALCPLAAAQTTDNNAAHDPSVFLDNHRPAIGKKQKAPTTRVLSGKVLDDTGQPLEGALVTLTDLKTSDKITVVTKKDGRYSFEDLSFTVDYEVAARYKDSTTAPRKLSQYDHSPTAIRNLEIAPAPADAKK